MACRIKIKEELYRTVDKKTERGLYVDIVTAKAIARSVNTEFKTNVVSFKYNDTSDVVSREITIPDSLVDIYYKEQAKLEEEDVSLRLDVAKQAALKEFEGKDFYLGDYALSEQDTSVDELDVLSEKTITPIEELTEVGQLSLDFDWEHDSSNDKNTFIDDATLERILKNKKC